MEVNGSSFIENVSPAKSESHATLPSSGEMLANHVSAGVINPYGINFYTCRVVAITLDCFYLMFFLPIEMFKM